MFLINKLERLGVIFLSSSYLVSVAYLDTYRVKHNPPILLPGDPPNVKLGKTTCRYGFPSTENLVFFSSYVASLNYRTSIPNWVAEKLNEKDISGSAKRKDCNFLVDKTVPDLFRSNNQDYAKSSYVRGHLVPSANHKFTQNEMKDTFILNANIVPQDSSMNGSDWLRLEKLMRKLARQYELTVFSGPLFLPEMDEKTGKRIVSYEVIGERNVAVPTHLWKVCLVEEKKTRKMKNNSNSNNITYACFLMPNKAELFTKPLISYQVSLETIEKFTGLIFFPGLNRNNLSNFCENASKCMMLGDEFTTKWKRLGIIQTSNDVNYIKKTFEEVKRKGFQNTHEQKLFETEFQKAIETLSKD